MPDTGFKSPANYGSVYNEWDQPQNALTSNNLRASCNDVFTVDDEDYYNFSFGVPAGATINGIEVRVEGFGYYANRYLQVRLSWDNGGNWTAYKEVNLPEDTEGLVYLGGAADTWGRAWAASEFSNGNFKLHGHAKAGNNDWLEIDHITVKVYYTTVAGRSQACIF